MMTSSLVTFIFIGTIILIIYWPDIIRSNNTFRGFVNVQRPIPNAQSGRLSNLNLKDIIKYHQHITQLTHMVVILLVVVQIVGLDFIEEVVLLIIHITIHGIIHIHGLGG